jgi:hypothetical protein
MCLVDEGRRIAITGDSDTAFVVDIENLAIQRRVPIAEPNWYVDNIVASPDGRWIAVQVREGLCVLDARTWQPVAKFECGESHGGMSFDASSTYLAYACPYQAGLAVRTLRLDGAWQQEAEIWRSDRETSPESFVNIADTLTVSPDGARVVFWESSTISHHAKPHGWRGNLVCVALDGSVRWSRSIDHGLTGNRVDLPQTDWPMGYPGPVAFICKHEVVAGCSGGLLTFSAGDGRPISHRQIASADILSIVGDTASSCFAGLSSSAVAFCDLSDKNRYPS